MNSGIYVITNLINGKKYIGQSVDVRTRFTKHKSSLNRQRHHNDYLQKAWNKYGEESFKFKILEFCDISELNDREVYWINKFATTNEDYGYNLEEGGKSNQIVAESTRKKLSIVNTGKHHSEETKRKLSEYNKKNPSKGFEGKHHSEESKRKISEAKRNPSEETRRKLRIANGNRQVTDETRKRVSKSHNTTGFFRVAKVKRKDYKRGFVWKYAYYDKNNKRQAITSKSIAALEKKVRDIGEIWEIIDEELAKKTIKEDEK